jgi:hypothetical protein
VAELLRSQKNELLTSISQAKLDPAEFEWARLPQGAAAERLVHRPSSFYFGISPATFASGFAFLINFEPGRERRREGVRIDTWIDVLDEFRWWLRRLIKEWTAPDLWAEVRKERELPGATGPGGGPRADTMFSEEERGVIAVQLREIRELIVATAHLDAAGVEALDERIRYAEEASHRLTRRDWANILVSTIASFAIEHALASSLVREVFRLAAHGLGHLFGGGFPELPSGPLGQADS